MSSYRDSPTRSDRAKAITAVAAVHVALAALVLGSQPQQLPQAAEHLRTTLIDIREPPPPPPPPDPGRAPEEEGAAGKKAEPSPVVAPKPKIAVPARTPIVAAPVAGTGSAATAGAASAGSGPGAGGSGSGRGGGGTGGGIGSAARLVSGGLIPSDYRRLRSYNAPTGRARLAIMVGTDGRVASCRVNDSSGDPLLDASLCAILQPRMRWVAARDTSGKPISVRVFYIATWERFY